MHFCGAPRTNEEQCGLCSRVAVCEITEVEGDRIRMPGLCQRRELLCRAGHCASLASRPRRGQFVQSFRTSPTVMSCAFLGDVRRSSFARTTGNVWSNPELTCQHVDPESSQAPGQRAVVEGEESGLPRHSRPSVAKSNFARGRLEMESVGWHLAV